MENDSEIQREEKGNGSRRGLVPPSRIKEIREKARFRISITPIDKIAEDYEAVVQDHRRKISEVTLRYMLKKRVIKSHLFSVYNGTSTQPEKRIMTETNVVADVNSKFIEMYDKA